MKRVVLTLSAVASAVLCAASVVLWARSVGHVDGASWAGRAHEVTAFSWGGRLGVVAAVGDGPSDAGSFGAMGWRRANPGGASSMTFKRGPNRWGFGFHVDRTVAGGWARGGYPIVAAFAPYWFLAAVFAVWPTVWLRGRTVRARRRRAGLCLACGYDLRASPGRCPECGHAAAAAAAAAVTG